MSRVLEAELTWTGAGFAPHVQVVVDDHGRIADVGPLGRPDPTRLARMALLPGFVDAHSHAFQRGLRGRGEAFPAGAGSFWSWREAMYALVESLDRDTMRRLSARAFAEMRDAGITTVGEFHYLHHEREGDFALDDAVVEAAADAGIRLVLLYSYYATGAPGRPLEGAQRRFATPSPDEFWLQVDRLAGVLAPDTQTLGIAPHSIRAASPAEIRLLHGEACRRGFPVHLHVEEQPREIEESLAAYGRSPMALILDAVEEKPFTAVHCTHTSDGDMERFLASGGSACLCPLTEGNLGDGIPRLARAHAAGGAWRSARTATTGSRCWRRCAGSSMASGSGTSSAGRCPIRPGTSRPRCWTRPRAAAPVRSGFPRGGSPGGTGRTSRRWTWTRRHSPRCRGRGCWRRWCSGRGTR